MFTQGQRIVANWRSYSPTGETPVVRLIGRRHGLSVISTFTNKGQTREKAFEGGHNSDVLHRLIKDAGRKVYLILAICAFAKASP